MPGKESLARGSSDLYVPAAAQGNIPKTPVFSLPWRTGILSAAPFALNWVFDI
jgi:hypothetical protein